MARPANLLITGFLRSGTTLLEKALHAHPEISVASQPAPMLPLRLKQRFLEGVAVKDERYPLGHLFLEERYSSHELLAFLENYHLDKQEIESIFRSMEGYSGWLMPELGAHVSEMPPGNFSSVTAAITRIAARILGKDSALVYGFKEVFLEEMIPVLISSGWQCLIIIRDPRDVLRSIRYNSSGEYASPSMNILHVIRQWRKSIAFVCSDMQRVRSIRFEELRDNPGEVLEAIAKWLCVRPDGMPADLQNLQDQSGRVWQNNSSFAGGERPELDDSERVLIELLCAPELHAMCYTFSEVPADSVAARMAMEKFLTPQQTRDELSRLEMVASGTVPPDVNRWFISRRAFDVLASVSITREA